MNNSTIELKLSQEIISLLGATIFVLTLVSLEITPTRVVEAFVSPRSALIKRELIIPESGEAIIAEPPTAEYGLFVSPESKNKVRDVDVALNDKPPLYRIRGAAGAKVYIYGEQEGLTWDSFYSAQYAGKHQMQFCAKRVVSNQLEDLVNIKITLVDSCRGDNLIPNIEDAIEFPFPTTPSPESTTITNEIPSNYTGDLTYNPASSTIIFANSEAVLGKILNLQEDNLRESQVLSIHDGFSLNKGKEFAFSIFDNLFSVNQIRLFSLRVTVPHRTKLIRLAQPTATEEIIVCGVPRSYLTEGLIPVTQEGNVVIHGKYRKSYGDQLTHILVRDLEEHPSESETEISRRRFSIGDSAYDLLTMRSTISISNREAEAWDARIIKSFDGELLGQVAGVKSYSRKLEKHDINLTSALVWTPHLKPGESKTITYTYRVVVDSAQK